jgi:hypothetical protein
LLEVSIFSPILRVQSPSKPFVERISFMFLCRDSGFRLSANGSAKDFCTASNLGSVAK